MRTSTIFSGHQIMKSVLIYVAQVSVVAVVGYILWLVAYGKPDIAFHIWLLICFAAAALATVPYVIYHFFKRSRTAKGTRGN